MRNAVALAALVVLAAPLLARAEPRGKPSSRPAAEFPRPDALSQLARRPVSGGVFSQPAEDVDGWALDAPPAGPPPMGLRAPVDAFERQLAAYAAKRGGEVRLTEPMSCLARQVGRFVLARKVRPGPATLAFMSSRCGVAEPIGMAVAALDLDGEEGDALVREALAKPLAEDMPSLLERGPHTAGVWYGREGKRAAVLLVTAQPLVRLDAFPRPGRDGRAVVTGELLRPAERLAGLVTQGRLGFRACEVDPRIALPRFAVRCPVDPADAVESLEIAAYPRGRIFGPVVVAAQLWPSGDPPVAFALPALDGALRTSTAVGRGEPRPHDVRGGPRRQDAHGEEGAADPLDRTLAELVNRVRKEAGLAPLAVAPQQSETAAALAPHYFQAAAARDEQGMETIVLGLRAGWQVQGLVRAGQFTSARSDDPGDAARVLSIALARPSGREALLHPEAQALAVGALREERGAGAIFATYALVDPSRAAAEAEAVVARLDAEREKRGVARAQKLTALEKRVAEVAAAIERGEADPRAATKRILPKEDPPLGPGMRYSWVGSAETLDAVAFPDELVAAPSLRVALAVAHCRPEGSPWARYCVVVAAHAPKSKTASAGAAQRG